MDLIQQHGSQRAVELSNVASSSSRQFDRSSSFTAGNPVAWDDDSSDSSESLQEASPSSWATGAFEPFEVEEQATEVKYLRSAYTKKVRAQPAGHVPALQPSTLMSEHISQSAWQKFSLHL